MPTLITRALLTVSDKTNLTDLAHRLTAHNIQILSTGGTATHLRAAKIPVTEVSDHTGFPEILDGRVKTLVPQIHAGLLARRDSPAHTAQLAEHSIAAIDLLVCNLYPFEAAAASNAPRDDIVEQIDIGGPALIRAAAKNHAHVAVLTDPAQYAALTLPTTTEIQRRQWAAAAYARTAAYDSAIAAWFAHDQGDTFPPRLTLAATLRQTLRYGENPHQSAALYTTIPRAGAAHATQLQGKELSYNNLADTDAALECVAEFAEPTIVIVKHANPCGVASAPTLAAAWDAALAADPVSAFGGIVAANRTLDGATAERIATIFTEVIVAPDADPDARRILARKSNLRLLTTGVLPDPAAPSLGLGTLTYKSIAGGLLVQTRDAGRITAADLRTVTKRAPTETELQDLLFAFRTCKHVKSNAIVFVRGAATVGIGAGQMSRVDSARIAAWKGAAGPSTYPSVAASDAFFPFADGLQALAAAGATAIIQPGGSMRDAEVIAAADEAGLAMVFTGMRHFRH